jgi:hypothetical protein
MSPQKRRQLRNTAGYDSSNYIDTPTPLAAMIAENQVPGVKNHQRKKRRQAKPNRVNGQRARSATSSG